MLTLRFKESLNVTLNVVLYERYTLRNVINRRKSREYEQKILRIIKDADLADVKNQLNIIYNEIDLNLRRNIRRSRIDAIVNAFLIDLNEFKHE